MYPKEKFAENVELIAGGVSQEEIEEAEGKLGVIFPHEYKEFLSSFGAGGVCGHYIYGLVDSEKNDPPLWEDVVVNTQRLRRSASYWEENAHLIPISDDGMGVTFFFDARKSPETHIWAIGPGVEKLVSIGFYKFFIDFSEGELNIW